MKKYLALLLAAIMALSLAACASTAKTEDAASTSGKLTMATEATFQPYEYYDGDAIVGIDVEVAQAIADKLGMELEVTDIAFDSIIPGVQTGKYDMGMAGMTVTDERKEQVNFSDSYATGVQVVIVKDDSPITSVDDLFADGASAVREQIRWTEVMGLSVLDDDDLPRPWRRNRETGELLLALVSHGHTGHAHVILAGLHAGDDGVECDVGDFQLHAESLSAMAVRPPRRCRRWRRRHSIHTAGR